MQVKIKKLNENAVVPTKAHESDFAYDLTATSVEEVAPGVYKYGTGIAIQIDEDVDPNVTVGFGIRPRSSIYKTGLVLANSVGTIDLNYTGELMLVFYKVVENGTLYKVGDRIGQLYFDYTLPIDFEEVTDLTSTDRGNGGFGSTGK